MHNFGGGGVEIPTFIVIIMYESVYVYVNGVECGIMYKRCRGVKN